MVEEDVDEDSFKSNNGIVSTEMLPNIDEKTNQPTQVEDLDEDTVCGIFNFKPPWLQKFATSKVFLVIYCLIGFVQGTTFTYTIGTLSTLEKRYAFPSKISGAIAAMDEIFPLFLGPLIGYFGGKSHRPRLMYIGMLMSCLCSFISAFPYFLYGSSEHLMVTRVSNSTDDAVCRSDKEASCEEEDRPPTLVAVACLFLGSFLKGFGNVAFYAIGASYMDDVTKRKNTVLYFAISWSVRLFGPIVGFLLSSACLKYYETPSIDPGITSDDPRWIGAWWVGHVIQGTTLLVVSSPFLLFPKRLPGQRQVHLIRRKSLREETFKENLWGLYKAFIRLLTNPLYMTNVISLCLYDYAQLGFFMMLPKYIENQFHISASNANLVSGPPTLFAVQISILFGGIMMWKFRPSPRQIIIGTVATYVMLAMTFLGIMIPSCKTHFLHTGSENNQVELTNSCNNQCNCTTSVMSPVCGPHGISYFSPCFAGCNAMDSKVDNQRHQNCSCTYDDKRQFSFSPAVESGFCEDDDCSSQLLIYIVSYFFMSVISHVFTVVLDIFCIRSVDPEDKSFCIGVFEASLSTASMSSPILYGALVDSSCLIWESSCGKTGNCWYYDLVKFKTRVHSVSAAFVLVSGLFYIPVYYYSPRFRNLYEDDDEVVPENQDTDDEKKENMTRV